MGSHAWEVWVIAGLILAGLEIKLPGFVVFWIGVGALLAAIPAALGLPFAVQLATFSAASFALFFFTRPLARRFVSLEGRRMRTNVDAMVGCEATVEEAVLEGGSGTVRIHGEVWTARSLTGALQKGEVAIVDRVEGLKLYVRRPGGTLGSTQAASEKAGT